MRSWIGKAIAALVAAAALLASITVAALDPPHTQASAGWTGTKVCDACHIPHQAFGAVLDPPQKGGATTEERIVNLCLGLCHYPGKTGMPASAIVDNHNCDSGADPANCRHTFGHTFAQAVGPSAKPVTCTSCHDPHKQDQDNTYGGNYGMLIKDAIKAPPANPVNSRTVQFYATDATPNFVLLNGASGPWGPCEVCHTATTNSGSGDKRFQWDSNEDSHSTGDTTACKTCHAHTSDVGYGFRGGGESEGGNDCSGCHGGIVTPMKTDTNTYHHVQDRSTPTYPLTATPAVNGNNKACTQCHVDHDIFNPDNNPSNTVGRGANLRSRIASAPSAGGAPDDSTYYYWDQDAEGTFTPGGICLSCHTQSQSKDTSDQKSDGTTTTPAIVRNDYFGSAHSYAVSGRITTNSSEFQVSCVKCHNSNTTTSFQDGTYRFALHTSSNRRLLAPMGIDTPGDPLGANFCWRCHSDTGDSGPGGGPAKTGAGLGYYQTAAMSPQAESIYGSFNNAFRHPVNNANAGQHAPTEGSSPSAGWNQAASNGSPGTRHVMCSDCHNPHAAQPIASGVTAGRVWGNLSYNAASGSFESIAARLRDYSTPSWSTNQFKGYSLKIVRAETPPGAEGLVSTIYSNTSSNLNVEFDSSPAILSGDRFIIFKRGTSDGNTVTGAMDGVWGVNPTFPSNSTRPTWDQSGGITSVDEDESQYGTISSWNPTSTPTLQGQICIKCHSAFGWGSNPPLTPSGPPCSGSGSTPNWDNGVAYNLSGTTTTACATLPSAGGNSNYARQSDLANQFNPNNLSHHAVFARGNNQPLVSSASQTSTWNTNWPFYTSGSVNTASSDNGVTLTSGSWPTTVLPGWFIYIGSNDVNMSQPAAGWYEVTSVVASNKLIVDRDPGNQSSQSFMLTAGLGNNFVPPWGPWSTLKCSDCHTTDTTADAFGPHGSGTKWLLRRGEVQRFNWYSSSGIITVTNTPTQYDDGAYHNICLNCHRRDVYGDANYTRPTYNLFPRQEHPVDKTQDHSLDSARASKWGITCMSCHGGARIGGIHGSNLGIGNGGSTAGSYSGKRLLNGSIWYAVTRSTTTQAGRCWTAGGDAVDDCAHGHSGADFLSGGDQIGNSACMSTMGSTGSDGCANYDYDSNP